LTSTSKKCLCLIPFNKLNFFLTTYYYYYYLYDFCFSFYVFTIILVWDYYFLLVSNFSWWPNSQALGPDWVVPLGRRDSFNANQTLATSNLPGPRFLLTELKTSFLNQGLDTTDLVALSGINVSLLKNYICTQNLCTYIYIFLYVCPQKTCVHFGEI